MADSILIIEDEVKIAQVLQDYLVHAGYSVSCLDRGDGAVSHVKKSLPSLILLDLMLPGIDGSEICREIRKFSAVPIIMITARVEEIDRIIGLELGADDYVCKPFSPREVVARVKAVLRRTAPEKQIYTGPIRIDRNARQVSVNEMPLRLTPSEYTLLSILLTHPGRVFSRAELIDRIQGYQYEGYERTIDSHIKNLRKKIAAQAPGQDFIHSVYGIGYKFLPDE